MKIENKPCKVFWAEPHSPSLYKLEGKILTSEQKDKLIILLEKDFQIITVKWKKAENKNEVII